MKLKCTILHKLINKILVLLEDYINLIVFYFKDYKSYNIALEIAWNKFNEIYIGDWIEKYYYILKAILIYLEYFNVICKCV